jgi:hypothetical protein
MHLLYGGFIVTIPIKLTLYIGQIAPIFPSPQPLPTPLKTIVRGFFVLFHVSTWSHQLYIPSP